MNFYCYCCGDDISTGEKKKRRRLLSSGGMKEALSALITIAAEQQSDVDVSKLHDGYVCRGCSCLLEKHASLHQLISSKIKTALPRLPSDADADTGECPMRPGGTPVPRIRDVRARPVQVSAASNKSPVVVVSSLEYYNYI